MIQLLNVCIFLSLTAKLSNADISVSLGAMTLSGSAELTCCERDQNISQCIFYAGSRNIGHRNSSDHCCKLTVSREELLQGKAGEELRTTITIYCTSRPDNISQNVTITVWRPAVFRFAFLVILGTLTLLSLLMVIVFICIIYKTKNQENKQNQSANSGTVEVQEEKTEVVEDELLYATVNHSAAGENFAPAVKYESGTDYATVVIH